MSGRNGVARKNREKREMATFNVLTDGTYTGGMNMVYCNVCGVEYNSLRVVHKCDPVELKRIFREEELHPEDCNLNGDDLKNIRQAIVDNGSPADLVAMWEKSAGRQWQA